VFDGAYHGGLLNFVAGGSPVNVPHDFVCGSYNDLDGTAALLRECGTELAAVIVEPMLGSGGCIPATGEFLKLLREMSRECGCVLIFDEVMTSRLAGGGVQQILDLRADMTTLGKYLGGGSSIGAFGGRTDIMSLFDPTRPDALPHAGTFNNNVISMTAGLVGLTRVYTPEQAEALSQRGSALREDLNRVCQELGAPLQVTGLGSLMSFHATREQISRPFQPSARQQAIKSLLFFHLLERGFYMARRGLIALSLAVGAGEIAGLLEAVRDFGQRYQRLWP
jgi:glutamate-1-semialdehyde 2,1-aminomutase